MAPLSGARGSKKRSDRQTLRCPFNQCPEGPLTPPLPLLYPTLPPSRPLFTFTSLYLSLDLSYRFFTFPYFSLPLFASLSPLFIRYCIIFDIGSHFLVRRSPSLALM